MSHITNLQAFEKLTGYCTGYGGAYNPGHQNLQVETLTIRLHNAKQAMMDVGAAQNVYNHETNLRELQFKELRKLTGKLISVLKSSGVTSLTLQDARALAKKIRGRLTGPPEVTAVPEGEPAPKRAPGFGSDYASIVAHFTRLVNMLAAEGAYKPNEPALKVTALEQTLAAIKEANTRVMQAEVQLTMARKKRNQVLYKDADSLHETLKSVRAYVRGVFGFMSTEHEKLSRLSFTKPKA